MAVWVGLMRGVSAVDVAAVSSTTAIGSTDGTGGVVIPVGDINGDGIVDFVAGGADQSSPKMTVYRVAQTGSVTTTTVSLGTWCGRSFATLGDAVGNVGNGQHAIAYGCGEWQKQGSVRIVELTTSFGKGTEWTMTIPSPPSSSSGDMCGWGLASGDFDGDGKFDLVIGCPGSPASSAPTNVGLFGGRVVILRGITTSGTSTTWSSSVVLDGATDNMFPNQDYAHFGWTVAAVPDLNGDGVMELAAGRTQYNTISSGDVVLMFLTLSGTSLVVDYTVKLVPTVAILDKAEMGWGVSAVIGPSGKVLIALGAPSLNGGVQGVAVVATLSSSGALERSDKLSPSPLPARFGGSLAFLGDMNGDGSMPELIAGVPNKPGDSSSSTQRQLLRLSMGDKLTQGSHKATIDAASGCCFATAGGQALYLNFTGALGALYHAWTISSITVTLPSGDTTCSSPAWSKPSSTEVVKRAFPYVSAELTCTLPAGVGVDRAVKVKIRAPGTSTDATVSVTGTVSYEPPVVSSLSSVTALASRSPGGGWSFDVDGRSFGTTNQSPEVFVGGTKCATSTWVSDTRVRCASAPACAGRGFPITVKAGGQLSTDAASYPAPPTLDYAPPTPTGVSVLTTPNAGSSASTGRPLLYTDAGSLSSRRLRLRVSGSGFGSWNVSSLAPTSALRGCMPGSGADESPALRVTVGGAECTGVAWQSDARLECDAPDGSGTARDVVVTVLGQSGTLASALDYTAPEIDSVSQTAGLKVAGGDDLFISGRGFGPRGRTASVRAFVGSVECAATTHVTDSTVQCRTPANIGGGHEVRVHVDGQWSASGPTVEYARPAVSSIAPQAYFEKPSGSTTWTITGSGFGAAAADVSRVVVGGQDCVSFVRDSASQVRCTAAPAAGYTDRTVQVFVGSGAAARANADAGSDAALQIFGRPSVLLVDVPGSGRPVASNSSLRLQGGNLGTGAAGDVVAVRVGGDDGAASPACVDLVVESDSAVRCTLQGGVGGPHPVYVTTRGGLESARGAALTWVSFDPPTISAISPASAVGGDVTVLFTITGQNLALPAEAAARAGLAASDGVPVVTVGGVPCAPVEVVSSGEVRCSAAPAPDAELTQRVGWTSRQVRVSLAGRNGTREDLFEFASLPVVFSAEVLPEGTNLLSMGGGETVRLYGRDLGLSDADVANVTVGGRECSGAKLVPGSAGQQLECTSPWGSGTTRQVVVTSRGALRSVPKALLNYRAPVVSAVAPAAALHGDVNYTFVVHGSSLGIPGLRVPSVSVGGVPCASVVLFANGSTLECRGVNPAHAAGGAGFSSTAVVVDAGGGSVGTATDVWTFLGPPALSAPSLFTLSVGGGQRLRLFGTNLGLESADVASVTIGGRACTSPAVVKPRTEVECTTPAGVGKDLEVVLTTRVGAASPPARLVSYAMPSVGEVAPSRLAYCDCLVNVTVWGDSFGLPGETPAPSVTVGGIACPHVVLVSSTRVDCRDLRPAASAGFTSTAVVVATAGGAAGQNATALEFVNRPVVISADPALLDTGGGERLSLFGADFAFFPPVPPAPTLEVTVDGRPCTDVELLARDELACTTPAGSGNTREVVVRRGGTVASAPAKVVSYKRPTVASVSPARVLSGEQVAEFVVRGASFGVVPGDVQALSVGGAACPPASIELRSSNEVACTAPPTTFADSTVSVTINGEVATAPGAFLFVAPPFAASALPRTLDPRGGTALRVLGAGFGAAGASPAPDVARVELLAAGAPFGECTAVQVVSDAELRCVAPAGAGAELELRVTSRADMRSDDVARAAGQPVTTVSFAAPALLSTAPAHLLPARSALGLRANVMATGRNLAARQHVDALLVGGWDCERDLDGALELSHDAETVTCRGLLRPGEWRAADVQVSVGGQWSAPLPMLLPGAPSVVSVTRATDDGVAGNPVAGGFVLRVLGSGWVAPGDVARVVLGDEAAGVPEVSVSQEANVQVLSPSELRVTIPPGVGAAVPVWVETVAGLASGERPMFGYEQPALASLEPAYALRSTGLLPTDDPRAWLPLLDLRGANLAADAASLVAVRVGGRECQQVAFVATDHVRCLNVSRTFASRDVALTLARVSASSSSSFTVTFPGAFDPVGPPVLSGISIRQGEQKGGLLVTLSGRNLGAEAGDAVAVWFGGLPASVDSVDPDSRTVWSGTLPAAAAAVAWTARVPVEHADPEAQTLTCRTPPGVGVDLAVRVETAIGTLSSAADGVVFSYTPPQVASVTPAYLFAGERNATLLVRGSSLGLRPEQLESVWLCAGPCDAEEPRARACARAVFVSSQEVVCEGADASFFSDADAALPAEVQVRLALPGALAKSSMASEGLFRLLGSPVVSFVSPATASPAGGDWVNVTGSRFGAAGDVERVSVGPYAAARWRTESESLLAVEVPAGVGGPLEVSVTTRGGRRGGALALSYSRPVVQRVEPAYVLSGPAVSVDVVVYVQHAGSQLSDISGVRVAGQACAGGVALRAVGEVECRGLRGTEWSEDAGVVVWAGGQPSDVFRGLDVLGQPVVAFVSPAESAMNTTVTLLGTDVGRRLEDVASVTIDGLPCELTDFLPTLSVQCRVPPPRAWRLEAATSGRDPSALSNLDVVLTTSGGLASAPRKLFSYAGIGVPPTIAPRGVVAVRRLDAHASLEVQWLYPQTGSPFAGEATREFEVLFSRRADLPLALSSADRISVDVVRSSPTRLLFRDPTSLTPEGEPRLRPVLRYEATVLGSSSHGPYFLAVRARTSSVIPGPWSPTSPPAHETCARDEFLDTTRSVDRWLCRACPVGAYCAGLRAENVTALAGYWRLPWTLGAATRFAVCPRPSSCQGWGDDDGGTAAAAARRRRLEDEDLPVAEDFALLDLTAYYVELPRESAVSDVELVRAHHEGCARGYQGNLCASCAEGFGPGPARYECVACPSAGAIGAALFFTVVAVVAVLAFLIGQAIRTKGRSGSVGIAVLKILMSHMQSISIIASLDMHWPLAVKNFMEFAEVTSAVSSSVFAVDCTVPESGRIGGRVFYSKAVLMLFMPLIISSATVLYWIVRLFAGRAVERATHDGRADHNPFWALLALCCRRHHTAHVDSIPSLRQLRTLSSRISLAQLASPGSARRASSSRRDLLADPDSPAAAPAAADGDIDVAPTAEDAASTSMSPSSAGRWGVDSIVAGGWARVRDRVITSLIVIAFVSHSSLLKTALELVTCQAIRDAGSAGGSGAAEDTAVEGGARWDPTIDADNVSTPLRLGFDPASSYSSSPGSGSADASDDGDAASSSRRFLTKDLDVDCASPLAQAMSFGVGVPAFVIYGLGIPIAAAAIIWHVRARVREKWVVDVLGFLFAGFRADMAFWESVIMVRKVLLAVVSVFLQPTGLEMQTNAALLVVVAAALVQSRAWPYELTLLNQVELSALVVAFITLFAGTFLVSTVAADGVKVLATTAILFFNVLFLLIAGLAALWHMGGAGLWLAVKQRVKPHNPNKVRRATSAPGSAQELSIAMNNPMRSPDAKKHLPRL